MVSAIEETSVTEVAVAPREFAGVGGRSISWAGQLPVLPLAILVPFILVALFADLIAPYDPTEPIPGAKIFEPPLWMQGGSTRALLGTDFQSRDVRGTCRNRSTPSQSRTHPVRPPVPH